MTKKALAALIVAAGMLVSSRPAPAQISGAGNNNSGSTCTSSDADGFCGSATQALVNNGTTFQGRYAWNVNTDIGIFSTRDMSGTARHNVTFNATAPGGYRLDIATSRIGALGRSSDASNCDGQAHTSGTTGSSNIALNSGTLSTASPGDIPNGGGNTNVPYNQSTTAQIFRVSNGIAQSHSLSFTWTGSTRSNSCETSVRQGLQNGTTTGCEVCEYPGTPVRTQSSDGHFVTVTITSLCGNGTIDGAVSEQCDEGSANGAFDSCCTATCQFRAAGETCRAAAGDCDAVETCTGSSATCPADAKSTDECRPAAGDCDVAESCNGVSNFCPADALRPSGFVCRAAAGDCDVAESCDGVSAACPADGKSTAGCRPAAGDCDVAENCDGSSNDCPADVVRPSGFICRAAADDCDVAEECDGAATACPADLLAPDGTSCDDGLSCSGPDTCTGGVCSGPLDVDVCSDDFLCYKTKTTQATPLPAVNLIDAFESGDFDVRKGRHVCTPADKNGEGIVDAATHLRSYTIKLVPGSPKHVRQTSIEVVNQIGTLTVDTVKPDLLLVPANKDLAVTPAAPDASMHDVNHYKCYRIKVSRGTPKLPKGLTVTVEDQFTSPAKSFRLLKPRHLCMPVDKNGEGIEIAEAKLLCYKVKPAAPKHVRRIGVHLNGQFGPEVVNTMKEDELCIPSTFPGPGSPSGAFLGGSSS